MQFGFDESSLNYMKNYLSDQKKRVEINNSLSNWTNILYEVSQGSISGPNLFNNFFCDLFLFLSNINISI